jgi:23S rRNA pseudouridine1911/1915/1917 synthase
MKHTADRKTSLLEILQEMAPDSSKNTLRSWLQAGRVIVDNQCRTRANTEILPGQEISIGSKVIFLRGSIRILHEDDDMVVLEKPEGLLSVATDFENRATVHEILKRRFHHRRVYPVHRLDRETSGVMMFAYTEKARDLLKAQFEQHLVNKTYFAIVEGEMALGKGTWESFLEEDDFYYVKSTGDVDNGKLAVTHFEVLKAYKNRSFLCLKPQTGRKNQLRVHCSEAGHPIIGDKKYRAVSNPLKRLCLHAQRISFIHPSTHRRMTWTTSLPEIFDKLFEIKDLKIQQSSFFNSGFDNNEVPL